MESDTGPERSDSFRYTMETEPGVRWAALLDTLKGEQGVKTTEKDGKTFLSVRLNVREPAAYQETQILQDTDENGQSRPLAVPVWYSAPREVTYDYPCSLTREPASSWIGPLRQGADQKQTIPTDNTDTVIIRVSDHPIGVSKAQEWARGKSIDLASLLESAAACSPANDPSALSRHGWVTIPLELWPTTANDINALGRWPSASADRMESKSGDDRETCLGVMYLPVHLSEHDGSRVVELQICPESLSAVFDISQRNMPRSL